MISPRNPFVKAFSRGKAPLDPLVLRMLPIYHRPKVGTTALEFSKNMKTLNA